MGGDGRMGNWDGGAFAGGRSGADEERRRAYEQSTALLGLTNSWSPRVRVGPGWT